MDEQRRSFLKKTGAAGARAPGPGAAGPGPPPPPGPPPAARPPPPPPPHRETLPRPPRPKRPVYYKKFNNGLNAHRGAVRVSAVPAERFDYESELVIVMGRKARNVSEAEALSYVFGYCIGHDFTARDLQSRSSQWMIGKTCDGFGLLGPYLVTADQIPDPNNLRIEGTVNGEVRQSSHTSDMVHNCATIISYA